ncbi:Major facilitator superfamily protein [Rhynchospora pubera]|uniref:Major facilitator superfamily protein n=1 Tax=Rhynchospora pubera TaxID=906938 RepID=A0AAV8EZX6_9POAL|nr:Major facilitator superfamily protein [Rhynchospora pubera]KAJ4784980.1 Major facilitator superfamily protein [Rhynchospora pubera]
MEETTGDSEQKISIPEDLAIKEPLIGNESLCSKGRNGDSNWMVIFSTTVAVWGSFVFGVAVGFSSPTQAQIREDLNLSLGEFSVFGSIVTLGALLGAVASGRITDLLGRKGAMRSSAIVCIIGWLAIYFAKGPITLDIGRICTGYGVGVFSYVVPVFIAEIAPKTLRGALTTLNQLFIVIGLSMTYIIGTFVTWRMLVLTGLIPCIILLTGLIFIPESPRWLAKVGRQNEFENSLRKLRGKDADVTQEATEILEYIATIDSLPKARIQDAFHRQYIRPVTVGVGLMFFQQAGGINGIIFYASETFKSAGFASGSLGTILMACFQVPLTILAAVLMDRSGRRPLLMISASGLFLGSFVTAMSFFLKSHGIYPELSPGLALTGILVYIGSFSIGMGAIPWVIMSEIFPINMKGIGGSLVTIMNWFGSWAVSYSFNFLMSWNSYGTFFIYSSMCALALVFIFKVVPETKGRTLEEIQASMNPTSLK